MHKDLFLCNYLLDKRKGIHNNDSRAEGFADNCVKGLGCVIHKKSGVQPSTVIGRGMRLKAAVLTGEEPARIDGDYVGNVDISALVIGESGCVIGDIRANTIEIAGRVMGNIHGGETVRLTATAHVEGSIETRSLIADKGSWFNGKCQMTNVRVEEVPLLEADAAEHFNHKVERFIHMVHNQQFFEDDHK